MSTLDAGRPAAHARDLLTRDLATIPDTAVVSSARSLMRHLGVRHLPVLGAAGLVGVLQDAPGRRHPQEASVLDHVTRDVPEVRLQDDLERVTALVATSPCDAVVVVDDEGHLLGVITATDLADAAGR